MAEMPDAEVPYLKAALAAAQAGRDFLAWMEEAGERLAPERLEDLSAETERRHGAALQAARAGLDSHPPPNELMPFALRLSEALGHAQRACEQFGKVTEAPIFGRIPQILGAMHEAARAQEAFYLLRHVLPPFSDYWLLPATQVADPPPQPASQDAPPTGLVHVSRGPHHGGFSLYVPEYYSPGRAWPLIVALHGGSGNGRDFLWTWVREAKSRGYLLVAPSAAGDTWGSLEERGVLEILAWTGTRYHLDPRRVLLTGLSDGATFTLLYGLAHPDRFRALAPLCGVLHPANASMGNLERARDVPIYLVHGALDFLFPVELARMARDSLVAAGARLEYRELADVSHTYPRSENVRIIEWFEALPG